MKWRAYALPYSIVIMYHPLFIFIVRIISLLATNMIVVRMPYALPYSVVIMYHLIFIYRWYYIPAGNKINVYISL